MIVVTRSSDVLIRQAIGKENADKVTVARLSDIGRFIQVDPDLEEIRKDAFIVTEADVKNRSERERFIAACKTAHVNAKIIYIQKGKKGPQEFVSGSVNNIYKVLIQPSKEAIAEAIYSDLINSTRKPTVQSDMDKKHSIESSFKSDDFLKEAAVIPPDSERVMPTGDEPEVLDIADEEDKDTVIESTGDEEVKPSVVEEMQRLKTISDLNALSQRIKASNIMKELARDSTKYSEIETVLQGLSSKINNILVDPSLTTLEEKMRQVDTVLLDKEYFKARSNTMIEKYVEDIIHGITSKVQELLGARLEELRRSIISANRFSEETMDFASLAAINSERSNLLFELASYKKDLNEIFANLDELTSSTYSKMAEGVNEPTENGRINDAFKMRHGMLVSDETIDSIERLIKAEAEDTALFKSLSRNMLEIVSLYGKLQQYDNMTIAALNRVIQVITSNNVEDSVLANTIMKMALNIYIGEEGSGTTVVPYVISAMESRMNANVLLIDLTSFGKYEDYGISTMGLREYLTNKTEDRFIVVNDELSSYEELQKLIVAINKSAQYYRYINVVMSPEQKEYLDIIAVESLCLNYIIDNKSKSIKSMKEFLDNTKYGNVARRVISNMNVTDIPTVVSKLGINEVIDIHFVSIPYVEQITTCGIKNMNPAELTVVEEAFKEVVKYASRYTS